MMYILVMFYMFAYSIVTIALLWKIFKSTKELNKQNIKESKIQRTHPTIQKSYDNAFGGAKAYELYKNKNGLYEPIIPSKGIKLKKKEE